MLASALLISSQALRSSTYTDQNGAQGDERHLLLERPAMQPVLEHFAELFTEADTLRTFKWQENMFLVARYKCACKNNVLLNA